MVTEHQVSMVSPAIVARPSVVCPYCECPAPLVRGKLIYPRWPDLWEKPFYMCIADRAWVGCHEGTAKPLGRLADSALRQAKQSVHSAFDPLWQAAHDAYEGAVSDRVYRIARHRAYAWLAAHLGIARDECHVGMFDVTTCTRAVDLIRTLAPTPKTIRAWAKARRGA